MNGGMSSTTAVVASLAATTGVLMVARAIKRSYSPLIRSKLTCRCGKVQGEISAKAEDSLRVHCYCEDCRNYANFIATLAGEKQSPMLYSCGETHLVQVCKSAISIHRGAEYLKLARRTAPGKGMFRYYASCCHTPIGNTLDVLGFVGVFEDNLDSEREQFTGPFCYCTKEASKTPLENVVPDIRIHSFLWNVLRYLPWAKAGPFDYSLEPIYWGEKTEKHE